MKFTIGTSERVQIWANGISELTLEATQSELNILLMAVKGRMKHCKTELLWYGIPEIGIVGKNQDRMENGSFNPVSYVMMADFYAENAQYVFGVNTMGQDFKFPILVDFRLIEQLTKALTMMFANDKEYKNDERAQAAILCISLFEVQQNYVYHLADPEVVAVPVNGSINLQKKRAWEKARENNEL